MKILGSDFDGTLAEGGIDEEKLRAVDRWRAAGNKFGIISGRGGDFYETLRREYPRLAFDFYAACNGAYILNGEGEVIYEAPCRAVPAHDLACDLYVGSSAVCVKVAKRCLYVLRIGDRLPEWAAADEKILLSQTQDIDYFHCFSVCFPSVEAVALAAKDMQKEYGEYLCPLPNGNWLDIVLRGVNKAEGLMRVAEHFGCGREDVIAVGDNRNDTDMLRAFRSYAMANGVAEARAAAGAITQSVTALIERELKDK